MTKASLAAVLMMTAAAHAGPPATKPEPNERDTLVRELAALPALPPMRVAEFMTVAIEDDFLAVHAVVSENRSVALKFTDWPGYAKTMRTPHGGMVNLEHTTFDAKDPTAMTQVQVLSSPVFLSINRSTETKTFLHSVQFLQNRIVRNASPVQLIVSDSPGDDGPPATKPPLRLSAPTFTDLCREYPAEVREHLMPLLKEMGAAGVLKSTDPAKAWQVLGAGISSDPKTAADVDAVLARLNADDFAARAKAEDELYALGPAGAAELRRRDDSKLSPDVRTAVENARRLAEPLPPAEAERLGRDPSFLLETLRLDDPRLAAAAAKRLSALTGRPLDLPVNLSRGERDRRVDAYAAATTQPTTTVQPPTELP